ncbi:lysostaphin resistance A-like protein [Haloferax sp. YSMS24]|uniref:CPBP family intramembrane glutamic endopeptidase n=1 Tax=Haloferax sp. YSMS24 TaxID=3388425 RepID=UPI00398CACC2
MTDWAAFTGFTGLVLVALLSFAYFSRGLPHGDGVSAFSSDDSDSRVSTPSDDAPAGGDGVVDADTDEATVSHLDDGAASPPDDEAVSHAALRTDDHATPHTGDTEPSAETSVDHDSTPTHPVSDGDSLPTDMPTYLLIANVAVSQAVLGGFLAFGAWYAGVPVSAFGLSPGDVPTKLGLGVALGVALYVVNRVGSSLSRRLGFAPDEALRETLTPETPTGWVLLLVVALPLIAGFEELLFRGALIGALSVGLDVSPWFLAAVSSVAFGVGHTAQGRLGIVVTGLLGFVLAATFVLTGSLLVVVVAHYLVNALEFVGNELFGW